MLGEVMAKRKGKPSVALGEKKAVRQRGQDLMQSRAQTPITPGGQQDVTQTAAPLAEWAVWLFSTLVKCV